MKISQIAAATLVPATLAGVVLTAMPFAQAAPAAAAAAAHTVHHAAPAKLAKTTTPAKPRHAVHHAARPAHAVAKQAAGGAAASSSTPAQASQAAAPAQPATASQPLTAGMSSFEQCVAWHESGDNPTASSAGLFGILPATWAQLGYSGTAGQASVAQQKVAFQRLYAQYGTSPWAPYDGC
jgi:hypothetical protein